MLTTNSTITDILEAYFFVPIQLIKLSEELVKSDSEFLPMQLKAGTEVIDRKILLRGKISRKNYVYTESIFVLNTLDDHFTPFPAEDY